jgi:hypothetical protein
MNRLDELDHLGERMRTEEDWPRPSVATLRARHRDRRRAVSSVVIAGLVLVVGAGVWINAVSEKTADVVGSDVEVFDGPTVPSYEGIPAVFQPTGPVDIVERGKLGGTNWYSIVYPAAGGLQCSGVIDVHGQFLAGGSCGSGSGTRAGTSFSFGNIGGVDVMYGNAADDVEVVEVALTDGTSLTTIPKRSSLYGAGPWVLHIPSTGGSRAGAATRVNDLLDRVYVRVAGRLAVIWPMGAVPPDSGDTPATGPAQKLALADGVGLTIEATTASSEGAPRLCTTTSLDGSTGVRSCFPVRSEPNGIRWAYLDHTAAGWVLSGVAGLEQTDLTVTIDGQTTPVPLTDVTVSGPFPRLRAFAIRLPDSPAGSGELRGGGGFQSFRWDDHLVAVGGRLPMSYPVGEGVDPPFGVPSGVTFPHP